jgi:hypothetical protein
MFFAGGLRQFNTVHAGHDNIGQQQIKRLFGLIKGRKGFQAIMPQSYSMTGTL